MTPKMREALDFITEFWDANRYCPSYQEISDGIGGNSKSEIFRLVNSLAREGYISKSDGNRALKVNSNCDKCGRTHVDVSKAG
jgi:SOS-response transcriptional repressor LexA